MVHEDHIRLIEKGLIKENGGVWADIGSGEGAFTLALRDILGEQVTIYSIDNDHQSLRKQNEKMRKRFPKTAITYIESDFMNDLEIPQLDGVLAANAIHFYNDTPKAIQHVKQYLKPQGKFMVVEYNVDSGNRWVPYPFSHNTFEKLTKEAGATRVELLATIPSDFLDEIYAAVAYF